MSRIQSKNTKPEILVRKFLHEQGFRFRLHVKNLPGKPDIVLPKYKTVIFVHGCFWHGHNNCQYFKMPMTRTEWWASKIFYNRMKDEKAINLIKKGGWKIIIIWECKLNNRNINQTFTSLLKKIDSLSSY